MKSTHIIDCWNILLLDVCYILFKHAPDMETASLQPQPFTPPASFDLFVTSSLNCTVIGCNTFLKKQKHDSSSSLITLSHSLTFGLLFYTCQHTFEWCWSSSFFDAIIHHILSADLQRRAWKLSGSQVSSSEAAKHVFAGLKRLTKKRGKKFSHGRRRRKKRVHLQPLSTALIVIVVSPNWSDFIKCLHETN